jgi:hypothetical protein
MLTSKIIERNKKSLVFAEKILSSERIYFEKLVPSDLEEQQGVYIIRNIENDQVLYVGKTTNLRTRLYTNHLQGNYSTARLKKYLIEDENNEIGSYSEAKDWIKRHCYFQFLQESDFHLRGQLEGLFSFLFDVKYIEK